jgi:hypothetical protein
MYVMSPTQTRLGASVEKLRARMLGATGRECDESVVLLNLRFGRARMPFSRISRATRFFPTGLPRAASSA